MANYFVPGYQTEAQFIKHQSPKKQMEMSVNCGKDLSWCKYNSLPELKLGFARRVLGD